MRKNILILTICFALSAGSTFAQCNCAPQCSCRKDVKKICPVENSYRYLTEQIKKERMAVSNALLLTEEQAKCRVELMRENSAKINEKARQLYEEDCKLKALEFQNASRAAIQTQKKNIKCLRHQIDEIVQNENKEFKKILDREQRAKFKMIQKLERKSVKDCQKPKDYYKSNPKMRQFALPKNTNCGCEQAD